MKKIIYSLCFTSLFYSFDASTELLDQTNENSPIDQLIEIDSRASSKIYSVDERQIVQPIGSEIMSLTIDGGGIRGIIPAVLITGLEEIIDAKMGYQGEQHIADFVDCIAGISVGGIISTLLSVTDKDGNSCYSGLEVYHLLMGQGQNIFERNSFSCFGLLRPLYTNENLIDMAKEKLSVVPSLTAGYPKLSDIKKVNFMGLAVDIANEKSVVYKNWKAAEDSKYDYYLHDVVVSTSAAPYYFPSYYMENVTGEEKHRMCDGGMCLNNPSQLVYNSMHKFFPDHKIKLISIGTGESIEPVVPDYSKGSGSILGWVSDVIGTFMWADSNNIDYALINDTYNADYCRFQTPLIHASSAMDDTSLANMINLKNDALSYFDSHFEEFENIANMLIKNRFKDMDFVQHVSKDAILWKLNTKL